MIVTYSLSPVIAECHASNLISTARNAAVSDFVPYKLKGSVSQCFPLALFVAELDSHCFIRGVCVATEHKPSCLTSLALVKDYNIIGDVASCECVEEVD